MNIFHPQTIYYYSDLCVDDMGNKIPDEPVFTVWWGVALYVDDRSLAQLVQRDPAGAYIVSHRTWQAKIGGKEYSDESWHLEIVAYEEGKLKPNDNYGGPPGGARTMVTENGTRIVALNYISVINTNEGIGYSRGENQIAVQVTWWVYAGAPSADVKNQFPKAVPKDRPQVPFGIGWDHYLHNWWTKDKPQLGACALATGTIQGTITWNWEDYQHSFTSPNTELKTGPQRLERGPFLPEKDYSISIKWWEYDKDAQKWVNVYVGGK